MATKTKLAERNEAVKPAKKQATAKAVKSVPQKKDYVLFVSAEEEIMQFDITVCGEKIRPMWDGEHEYLIWRVPAALADRFAMHEFVVRGRIIRED